MLDVVLVSEAIHNAHVPPNCNVDRCDYTSHHYRVDVEIAMPRARSRAMYRIGRAWNFLIATHFYPM